ncbi:MAG: rod shape-determining protein MreC [Methyloceanibacter sp.]
MLTFGLYFLCTVFLILSRIDHGVVDQARDKLVDLSGPLLEAASLPAIEMRRAVDRGRSYIQLAQEIDRLKGENEQLKQWEWRTKLLERKLDQLRALLHAVEEPGLQFASGRVIADARGPFVRSALINLGRDHGLRVGYAVINGEGFVGRTIDVGNAVARVLLLNDLNSRIPVLIGPAGVRGLAVGDNSVELQLDFIADGASLYAGDEVYTSGSDGLLPRGLRVGVVTGSGPPWKVRPYADMNTLDAVSVLFFDAPALARTDPPIAIGSAPPPPPADISEVRPPAPEKQSTESAALPATSEVTQTGGVGMSSTSPGQTQAEQ